MKTRLVLTMALYPWLTQAQVSNTPIASPDTPPVVVETGPHHRVWQRVVSDGLGGFLTNSFTELATGLNYLNQATGGGKKASRNSRSPRTATPWPTRLKIN